MTDEELRRLAEWIVQTCLLFGATPATAYLVAGTFIQGLEEQYGMEAR